MRSSACSENSDLIDSFGRFSSRSLFGATRDHDRIHVIVPLVPSVPLEIAYDRQAPTECHSRHREERAHGPRGQHTFAGNGVRAATVRVEASRRSICCPYDALPASAPSVSTPPPGRIAAATTATTTVTVTITTTTSIAHRDTVVSRLPISRPSASSGPHSAAGSPSRSPTPPEPTFVVPRSPRSRRLVPVFSYPPPISLRSFLAPDKASSLSRFTASFSFVFVCRVKFLSDHVVYFCAF